MGGAVTGRELRVLVYHSTPDPAGVHEAYHRVSELMNEVPGMLGNELLHSVPDPSGFVVVSRWRDMTAFQQWERGPLHRETTAPLRPFRDTRLAVPYGIYSVAASY
jgi:heme-degrading monooxygenase HmoA